DSEAFIPRPGEPVALEPIVVPGGVEGRSAAGRRYPWHKNTLLCGELPDEDRRKKCAALVVHADIDEAPVVAESLGRVRELVDRPNILFAVVVQDDMPCADSPVPILQGRAPSAATTYLIDRSGEVVLETFDLPPMS
ncbi:MAG: hypothetical protein GWN84_13985, partial [Gammaproteobacteria bacterium]|nr:hypothetical protein [Gammaproteobacteria bacterium]NIR83916.1 hypothetical protein [Gammaproteobacteria bacterium]NIU05208.1 hypothetical protein [Gammaproteobacteria bacterium]NIV52065.1 hypothetical protein [Gammaproteobacteria bacterium]NIX86481.1 hypothetical protein [Gammaproteobacteria bacterium]